MNRIGGRAEVSGACRECLTRLPGDRTDYCSQTCKKRAESRRRKDRLRASWKARPKTAYCPTPTKGRFESESAASVELRRRFPIRATQLCVYQCRCGWWHIGHPDPRYGQGDS